MKTFCTVILLALSIFGTSISSKGDSYILHELNMDGGFGSCALDINDFGQIVGYVDGINGTSKSAVVWDNISSGPNVISSKDDFAVGYCINNCGTVAGLRLDAAGNGHIFSWSQETGCYDANLGVGDKDTSVRAINDNGMIIGCVLGEDNVSHAYISNGTGDVTYLGNQTYAEDANDLGFVAGYATASSQTSHAFVWHANDATDLGTFGGLWSTANAINNVGQVVGNYGFDGYYGWFLWSQNSQPLLMSDNSIFDQTYGFTPIGINDYGEVVGSSVINGEETVVTWSVDQGYQIVGKGKATAINDAGWISGSSDSDGTQAIVWQPETPEPSSILALFGGVVGLGGFALKRKRSVL